MILNFLSVQHFFRVDVSEGKQYSLSNSTKKILGNLNDLVTIKGFFTENLPPHLALLSRQVKDMLDEYRAYGRTNVQVLFVDPAKDAQALSEAQSIGIPEIQMNVIEKESFQTQKGYLGIGVFFAGKTEIIPLVDSISNLEYLLTSTIKKVTSDKPKNVGFLTGHEEHGIYETSDPTQQQFSDYTIVRDALEDNYETVTVDIKDGVLTKQVDTLVVAGPKKTLSAQEVFALDQFLMKGGSIVFLIDRLKLIGIGVEATTVDTGMEEFLSHLGVKVKQNAVLDLSTTQASFRQEFFQWIVDYPLWPKFLPATFSKSNPVVTQLESLVLPWSSSIELDTDKVKLLSENKSADTSTSSSKDVNDENTGKPTVDILVKTDGTSWTQNQPFNFNPQLASAVPGGTLESVIMAVFVSGNFDSFFKGKPIPSSNPSGDSGATASVSSAKAEFVEKSQLPGKILVVPDSDFASDGFLNQFPPNLKFFLNMVDFVTLDPDLITIRSKRVLDRPLSETSNAEKLFAKALVVWAMPILVGVYGILRVYRRRKVRA